MKCLDGFRIVAGSRREGCDMTADGCWGVSVCKSARETILGNQFGDKKLIAYNVLNVWDVVPVDD